MAKDRPPNALGMSPTDRANGRDKGRSSTDSSRLCLVPRHKFIGTAGHRHSYQTCLTISDDEIGASSYDAEAATDRELQDNVTLQFHMYSSVWDVIHKEVMDWRDSSWTSMHLPGDTMYFTLCLPSWNAKEPRETPDRDDPVRQLVAKMITVQLLASCFTSPQNINTLTLPSGWYHRQYQTNDKGEDLRLVSSLGQHTQWKRSPAHGHHARSNSAVSLWPDQDRALSVEDRLAENISRERLLRRRDRRATRKGIVAKFCSQGEPIDDESREHRFLRLRHRRPRKTKGMPSSQRFLPGRYGRSRVPPKSEDRMRQANILRVIRDPRQRDTGDDGHRWSLEPVLRSERHTVFVQPVKERVIKKWEIFGSRIFSESSTYASGEGDDECLGRQCRAGTSRDSNQLSRRPQVTTLIQRSGSSLGMSSLDSDLEASADSAPGSLEDLPTLDGSPPPLMPNTITSSSALHQCSALSAPINENMEETPYFPPIDHPFVGPLEALEVGQTRNRSGTTVYTPSSISSDTMKLDTDGSTSATPTDRARPKFL